MAYQKDFPSENNLTTYFAHHRWVILLLILLLAAFLRLFKLGQISPPGLNQDEAANAWSSYCLLKTGKDYAGVSWPVFYLRNVGGNSSSLYVYMLLPCQALAGLNVYTTRLPAALAAIFNVWLIYFCARRLFNLPTALAAAALLAIDPWDIQHSRWGHDASVTPFLSLLPLALMLWANLPICENKTSVSPRPVIAAVAGILSGIVCYGYYAVRLFVPVFILLAVLFTLRHWRQTLKTKRGLLTVVVFFVAFTASYGPLFWHHIFHPEGIARHLSFSPDRIDTVPFAEAIKNTATRYVQHFGPHFLFIEGDTHPVLSPPRIGQFYWYMLPLMLAGLISLIWRFKSSLSAKVVVASILAYPVGDCLIWDGNLSILRSAPGLCGLLLLAAVGAIDAFRWLWSKNHNAALATTAVFGIVVIAFNVWYLNYFFGEFNRRPDVYHLFHTDLVKACEWLRPGFNDYDIVFCTTSDLNMPYVVSAVVLGYDPKLWFSQPRDFVTIDEWDYYTRYGKMHFLYDYSNFSIAELQKKFAPGRMLLILRPDEYAMLVEREKLQKPNEFKLENPAENIVHRIYRPDGSEVLWLCRF
ncbi:MAG: glycosyltransferase family 39 protein [Phycisphaerae bacterium]|jgi:4-amino-4-deoxy-L-arabinose transferase-like glycosyltransferase